MFSCFLLCYIIIYVIPEYCSSDSLLHHCHHHSLATITLHSHSLCIVHNSVHFLINDSMSPSCRHILRCYRLPAPSLRERAGGEAVVLFVFIFLSDNVRSILARREKCVSAQKAGACFISRVQNYYIFLTPEIPNIRHSHTINMVFGV